jgi:hypothetical protein
VEFLPGGDSRQKPVPAESRRQARKSLRRR